MFFCYLFQHGLFIWKLFSVISILTVTSFKWLFFFLRAKTQVMHIFFFLFFIFAAFYLQNICPYWLGLFNKCTHVIRMQIEETHRGCLWSVPGFALLLLQANPPLNLLRIYSLWKKFFAHVRLGNIFLGGGIDSWLSYFLNKR